jgi:hypothetical protein
MLVGPRELLKKSIPVVRGGGPQQRGFSALRNV